MKILRFFFILFLFSCSTPTDEQRQLEARIDSLQQQLSQVYKPGFGEFMSHIQIHHAKLWFAGQNKNWKLADFEVHEIRENIEALTFYQKERKESQLAVMLFPKLDSVASAIRSQNIEKFRSSFDVLTKTCNDCHRAADFEFNMVKIPDQPPFSNQGFK